MTALPTRKRFRDHPEAVRMARDLRVGGKTLDAIREALRQRFGWGPSLPTIAKYTAVGINPEAISKAWKMRKRGYTNAEIAARLGIKIGDVPAYTMGYPLAPTEKRNGKWKRKMTPVVKAAIFRAATRNLSLREIAVRVAQETGTDISHESVRSVLGKRKSSAPRSN